LAPADRNKILAHLRLN